MSGRAEQLRLVEALLFAVAEPIGQEALALHLDEAADIAGLLRELASFLPRELRGEVFRRSALAATFAATLELARSGRLELRQDRAFGPIYLRGLAPATALDIGAGG